MRSVLNFHFWILLCSLVVTCSSPRQALCEDSYTNSSTQRCKTEGSPISRVFPAAPIGCGRTLVYLGTYLPDGKFQAKSKRSTAADTNAEFGTPPTTRPTGIPESVHLRSWERTVENFVPRAAEPKRAKGQSILGNWRDNILTFAYGHEKPMLAPRYLTTDSQGRAIISDPSAPAIHVLDSKGGFRIPVGDQYRLHTAGAVAVDAKDNIYAADSDTGLVIVFDRYGHFLREIGRFNEDEGLFHDPSGIAIDAKNERLYVSDSPRDTVFVLTLEGKVLRRMGGRRNESGLSFQHPESVVVKNENLVVLEAGGSRIQVLDRDCKLLHTFATGLRPDYNNDEIGLAADSDGDIYLSNVAEIQFRVFDQNGRMQTEFGARGSRRGEFYNPAAIWIDAQDKMYVSDEGNRRVQVFQISSTKEKGRPEVEQISLYSR